MKSFKSIFTIIYILFSINALCELGCDSLCDEEKKIIAQEDECKHISCEPAHSSNHRYLSSEKINKDKFTVTVSEPEDSLRHKFNLIAEESISAIISTKITTHSKSYSFYKEKKVIVFQRLKLHC